MAVMEKHDIIVVGGGHNGLIVAAYMAKAGLDVLVIERQDKVGGGVVTREVTLPGFKQDTFSTQHGSIQANPLIHKDELGLKSKYGLNYILPEIQMVFVYPDDRALIIYQDIGKTCESIRQFSEHDAEAYPRFCEHSVKIIKAGQVAYFSPPPPFGRMVSVLDSSETGQEFYRVIMSSAIDIAEEWFESDQVKAATTRWVCENLYGPRDKGSANYINSFPFFHGRGMQIPEGGSGALADALVACIKDTGGTIKASTTVKTLRVESGAVKGVVLDTGEEIAADRAVVSNLHVKQLFLDMIEPDDLPEGFPEKVKNIKQGNVSPILQLFALNEAPKYKVGGDVNCASNIIIVPSTEELLRSFDDCYFGIPFASSPAVICNTLYDPTRAPEGKHTLYIYHLEPYDLKDGGAAKWDEAKEEIADRVMDTVKLHTTNLGPDNILGRWISSPLDFYRSNPSYIKGDYNHFPLSVTQSYGNRPLPGWGQFRTPVKKLYICGPSAHPGGGVWGSGRATVQVLMEDLDIDFRKVVST